MGSRSTYLNRCLYLLRPFSELRCWACAPWLLFVVCKTIVVGKSTFLSRFVAESYTLTYAYSFGVLPVSPSGLKLLASTMGPDFVISNASLFRHVSSLCSDIQQRHGRFYSFII